MARTIKYVYGKCMNRDYKESGSPCPMCESKEIQRVIQGHDFVCSECGEPLHKVQPPKTFWQKYGKLITAVICILAAAGLAILVAKMIKNRPEKPVQEPVEEVAVADTIETAAEEPAPVQEAAVPAEQAAPEETPAEQAAPVKEVKPKAENQGTATSSVSKKDLGYAVYKGKLKNGVPDDEQATLTFKESHIIDSRDPQKRVAEPGDYVLGEFVDGHLVQGIWYDSANNVKQSIIIGR